MRVIFSIKGRLKYIEVGAFCPINMRVNFPIKVKLKYIAVGGFMPH